MRVLLYWIYYSNTKRIKVFIVFKEYILINPLITTYYQRKMFIINLTNLTLQYNEKEYKQIQCNYY